MNAKLLLSVTNATLYLVTCALIGTGLLLELRMDEEDGATRLFGMGRDDVGEVHFMIALAFALLVVFHLVQKRAWIHAVIHRSKWAMVILSAGAALVVILLLWPATMPNTSLGDKARQILIDD